MLRADREDVTAQREALAAAREAWRDALAHLEAVARRDGCQDVADEARTLARGLASRAKRPPAVDGRDLAGSISAEYRAAVQSDDFDRAVESVRSAEQAVDLAAYDLRTASGEDG